MIQDIFPSKLKNEFSDFRLQDNDIALFYDSDGRGLLKKDEDKVIFTTGADARGKKTIYLFSVDDKRFFLVSDVSDFRKDGFSYYTVRDVRDICMGSDVYALFTAYHLWKWYTDNKYCGRCGEKLTFGTTERSLVCPKCKNTVYPRINPAVIVGVKKDDSLLITRYNRGYAHNALVAGFTEIGETLEETVAREVMEETGIKVKNIRYYKSQPWGMAQDILVGYYCDVDGDSTIRMDASELKYAEWVRREDIELQPNNLSLTNEMMKMFKDGQIR